MDEYLYDAFISYSHRDLKWGRWLQRRLENLHMPREVVRERGSRAKLRIFRDQTDLAGAELQASLNRELTNSRCLIVICSPASAASKWVNEEIQFFCGLGRKSRIIPLIVSGEPFSDSPEAECYPPALRNMEGDELLGANIQEIGKDKAALKVASVLLDVRFNRLVNREKQHRRRVALSASAAGLTVALVTGILLWQNHTVTQENHELNYEIYTRALMAYGEKNELSPEDIEILKVSADEGNATAMIYLADCYLNGRGVPADGKMAFSWYEKAAAKEKPQGLMGLGNCYNLGIGTEPDPRKVYELNMRAAQLGDSAAMINVASCYEGGQGVEQNLPEAFRWYEQSARAGNDLGMYHLSRCYMFGVGVEKNPEQAFFWTGELAKTGNAFGMYNLALMYQNALGTEENPKEAYRWCRKAAELGEPSAMRMLGWCIENQYGVDNLPLEWYQRAAEAGDEKAKAEVRRITGE